MAMIRNALILAALVAASPALAQAPEKPAPEKSAADKAADRAADRAAEPTECLQTRSIQQTTIGPDNRYYARTAGKTWWRNTMDCPVLEPHRAIVHTSPIGSQCRGDIIQIVDFSMGGVNFGACGLGRWERVPGPPGKDAPKDAPKP